MMAAAGTCPFTQDEFKHILAVEKATSADDGWTRLKETENVEIWRKIEQGVNCHLFKVNY